MTIMGKRFTNRGISTIIAALLLIAIAIAAGVLLYVFSIGLIGSLQGSGGQQVKDQVIMEAYSWGVGTTLTLNMRNTGSTTVNLGTADYYVNATLTTEGGTTVAPGGTDLVTLTTASGFTSGAAYVLKIGLSDGGIFSYSVIYGTASSSGLLHLFFFSIFPPNLKLSRLFT